MYEVTVTDEFARWFEALPDAEAESVATLLGVVGEVGPALGPQRARRALLWYDGSCSGSLEVGLGAVDGEWLYEECRQRVEALESFEAWRREALRCLESEGFSRLLGGLDPRTAGAAMLAVERLKQRLHAIRSALRWPERTGSEALAQRLHIAPRAASVGVELAHAFDEVMRQVGLDPVRLPDAGGLREVTLRELSPPARIIYGLDLPARSVVVLVADRLDREYYGDSVRMSEARFAEYLAGRQRMRRLDPGIARSISNPVARKVSSP